MPIAIGLDFEHLTGGLASNWRSSVEVLFGTRFVGNQLQDFLVHDHRPVGLLSPNVFTSQLFGLFDEFGVQARLTACRVGRSESDSPVSGLSDLLRLSHRGFAGGSSAEPPRGGGPANARISAASTKPLRKIAHDLVLACAGRCVVVSRSCVVGFALIGSFFARQSG